MEKWNVEKCTGCACRAKTYKVSKIETKRFVIFINWKKFHLSLASSVRVIFIKVRNCTNISIYESPTSAICLSLYKISYLFKLLERVARAIVPTHSSNTKAVQYETAWISCLWRGLTKFETEGFACKGVKRHSPDRDVDVTGPDDERDDPLDRVQHRRP